MNGYLIYLFISINVFQTAGSNICHLPDAVRLAVIELTLPQTLHIYKSTDHIIIF